MLQASNTSTRARTASFVTRVGVTDERIAAEVPFGFADPPGVDRLAHREQELA